jgi:hypothetical protein
VLEDVRQGFLQDAHDLQALGGGQHAGLDAGRVPAAFDVLGFKQTRQAVPQRRDLVGQRGLAVLLACGRVDDDAQVVAQLLQDGQKALWRDIVRRALECHDATHQRATQAVVQVMRKVETLTQAGVGDLQFVLALQRAREFRLGLVDAAREVFIEALDAAQVRHKMPAKHERHADHLQLRRQRGVVHVVVENRQERQQVVGASDHEHGHASAQDAVLGAPAAPRKEDEREAGREIVQGQRGTHQRTQRLHPLVRCKDQRCTGQHDSAPKRALIARPALPAEAQDEHRV